MVEKLGQHKYVKLFLSLDEAQVLGKVLQDVSFDEGTLGSMEGDTFTAALILGRLVADVRIARDGIDG